jgi:hypothetical protein
MIGPRSLNLLKAAVELWVEGRRGHPLTERTAWVRSLAAPVREFVASAVDPLAATVVPAP